MFCAGLGTAAVHAAAPFVVQLTAASPAAYPAPLQVIEGLGSGITIDQVAALPSESFGTFSPTKLYQIGFDTPLWLKLKISAPQALPQSAWLLEFPSIIVDRYEYSMSTISVMLLIGGAWRQRVTA